MADSFTPRKWTRRARRKGGLVAIVAALVLFSYFWIGTGWISILFLDAISMVDPSAEPALQPLWVILGLTTLVALPVFAADRIAAWWARRSE